MRIPMLAVLMALGAACANSDERAIEEQMSTIAEALTVPSNDGDLGRLGRIASLRRALAPDIQLSTGAAPRPGGRVPPEIAGHRFSGAAAISGRDAVLALAGRWVPPPGGVIIEFVDLQITVDDGRTNAQVYCTAKATSRSPEKALVDARELTVAFSKIDGQWLVTAVRPEQTLAR